MTKTRKNDRKKPEIRIRHIQGGMMETMKTGVYPDYYLVRSRKYEKSWKVKELPAELKFKGKVVYSIEHEFEVYDGEGRPMEDIELSMEMRD
ncbi:hypothetical protein AB2B38_008455 [Balneola sp. MJW-20]|uniref:hypothetical protein n=1 Tax=Gracilimonas aurantiaca TaxID=3234185 RepID=UPI003465F49A